MIAVLYCPECSIVTGVNAYPPAEHKTGDNTLHECLSLEIEELQYNGETGFLTADNTLISSFDEWLNYLVKYIP